MPGSAGSPGNYAGAVWFGNDDYTSMNKMTGGTLPAMTWHDVMAYAHQGIQTRPPFGLGDNTAQPAVAAAGPAAAALPGTPDGGRSSLLSARTIAVIGGIATLMHKVDARQASGYDAAPSDVYASAPAIPAVRLVDGRIKVQ